MSIIVYPNPNIGKFYVELNKERTGIQTVELYNVEGELIYNGEMNAETTKMIELENSHSGSLTLHVRCEKFEYHQTVVVKDSKTIELESFSEKIGLNNPSQN